MDSTGSVGSAPSHFFTPTSHANSLRGMAAHQNTFYSQTAKGVFQYSAELKNIYLFRANRCENADSQHLRQKSSGI